MVDLAIGAAIASLKSAGEMAGSFLKLRGEAMIQAKVIELQSVILTAQSNALAAQGEQFALLDEKRGFETKIADLEAWSREKQRYKLNIVGPGSTAYTLKERATDSEPPHALCGNCYEHGLKSIFQATDKLGARRCRLYHCWGCGSEQPIDPRLIGDEPERQVDWDAAIKIPNCGSV